MWVANEWRAAPFRATRDPGLNGIVCNLPKPIVPLSPGSGVARHSVVNRQLHTLVQYGPWLDKSLISRHI
jgi:hypothetical protein